MTLGRHKSHYQTAQTPQAKQAVALHCKEGSRSSQQGGGGGEQGREGGRGVDAVVVLDLRRRCVNMRLSPFISCCLRWAFVSASYISLALDYHQLLSPWCS